MTNKLYVARLPFVFSDDQLRSLFEVIGPVVSAKMIPDPKNNRTRGFGFVTMEKAEDAAKAIAELSGKQVEDKQMWVTEAREKKTAPPASTDGFSNPPRRPFGRPPERGYSDSRPPRRFSTDGPSRFSTGDNPRFSGPRRGFNDRPRSGGLGFGAPPRGPRREGSGFGDRPSRREGGFGAGPGGPPRRFGAGDKPRFGGPSRGPSFGAGPRGPRKPFSGRKSFPKPWDKQPGSRKPG